MTRSSADRSRRIGFTLIEVVMSLVLLATLVTSMVVAFSAHHRQSLRAMQKQTAIRAADELLSQWYASGDPQVPRTANGILKSEIPLVWRTEIVHQNVVESLPVEIVRLQVFSSTDLATNRDNAPKPLAQVDVVLPIPEERL